MKNQNETILYLVRHGETEGNLRKIYQGQMDTPLTEKGREQARLMGKRIAEIKPDVVYASDLGRARETAAIACTGLDIDIKLDKTLRERHFGIFQGKTFSEAKEKYPDVWANYRGEDPDYRVPEGETFREFVSRVHEGISSIAETERGKVCAVFTHGGVVGYYLSWLMDFVMKPGHMKFLIQNGSFTKLDYSENRVTVLSFGDTHHIDYPI